MLFTNLLQSLLICWNFLEILCTRSSVRSWPQISTMMKHIEESEWFLTPWKTR